VGDVGEGKNKAETRCRKKDMRRGHKFIIGMWCVGTLAILLLGRGGAADSSEPGGLVFSTYVGGSGGEAVRDVTTDREGNIYITGGTESSDFPVTPGAYQTMHNPSTSLLAGLIQKVTGSSSQSDVFVTKLDAEGNILWSTFVGGPSHDREHTGNRSAETTCQHHRQHEQSSLIWC